MPNGSYNGKLAMKRAEIDHVEWTIKGIVLSAFAIVLVAISLSVATLSVLVASGGFGRLEPALTLAINVLVSMVAVVLNLLAFPQGHLRLLVGNWYLVWASLIAILVSHWWMDSSWQLYSITLGAPLMAMLLMSSPLFRRTALNHYVVRAAQRDAKRQLQRQLEQAEAKADQ